MAGDFRNFNDAVAKFNADHGVNFSFEDFEAQQLRKEHMREFFTPDKRISSGNAVYREMLEKLYREAVESAIAKKVNSVDHSALIRDFDKLMDNYRQYYKDTERSVPDKNGGWKSRIYVVEAMQGKLRGIPNDKSDYMKDKYIKREFRLRDMRADIEGMGKEGKPVTAEELSRAIVYAKALEKTVKERSFLWKATHWFQGPAENRDLKAINAFIESHRNSEIYAKAVEFAGENVVEKANSALEATKKEIKDRELLRPRRIMNAKEAGERIANKQVTDHVLGQIRNYVKETTTDATSMEATTRWMIHNVGTGIIQNMWRDFENAKKVEEKENVLRTRTMQIFEKVFHGVKMLNGLDVDEQLVATQQITNLLLTQYSPATSDKQFDKYCENYTVSDEKYMDYFMKQTLGVSVEKNEDLKEIINGIKEAITSEKEKVKVSTDELTSKNIAKSEKHVEVPSLDAKVRQ